MLTETNASAAPESLSQAARGNLKALLYPIEEQTFFEQFWNRKALFIPGTPDKFSGLFNRAAFDRGVHTCADLKVGFTDEKGWPGHFNIKPEQIQQMLAAGKTVCASVINPGNPVLTTFLQQVATSFFVAGRFFFNSYLSPDGAGFGLHLDHHPVSILQIEGQKRWWYSNKPAVEEVITNISFPKDRDVLTLPWVTVHKPREEDLCEVVLRPGDVLYLPKGTWHRAQAIGGSLGLTLAMNSAMSLDLIQSALMPLIMNSVQLRTHLPGYPVQAVQNGAAPLELEQRLESALAEIRAALSALSPADLLSKWRQLCTAASSQ